MFKLLIHNYNYRILNPSLRPVAAVQIPVSDGFGDVHRFYLLRASEVGDGASHLEDAAVGTGGELQALHGHAEHVERLGIGLGKLAEHLFGHLGIAVDALVGLEALLLNLTRSYHPLTDGGRGFAWLHLRELGKGNRLNLALNVDAVEEGTRDLVHIALYLTGRADTLVVGVAIVTTRAGIHGGHEHERGGIGDIIFGAGDVDGAVLERLTQDLQHGAWKLGQLVTEEDTIVGQADFARLGILSATYECHRRDRVMGGAEGTLGNERTGTGKGACNGVDLCGLETLVQREWRQDAGKSLGQHRLAAPRRAYHEEIMSACRCNLEGTLHLLLAFDLREVELVVCLLGIELGPSVNHRRLYYLEAVQMAHHLIDVIHTIDLQIVHHGCLACVLFGNEESLEPHLACLDGSGECASDGDE